MPVETEASLGSIQLLSNLIFSNRPHTVHETCEYLCDLSKDNLLAFQQTADTHHVIVRALQLVHAAAEKSGAGKLLDWSGDALTTELHRISRAIGVLAAVTSALESAGSPAAVIKSLDHWPDLGSDLDLYTGGEPSLVVRVMRDQFHAALEPRSWGDRLAGKWNFRLPGLPELIEIHVGRLGQTGEQHRLAQRVIGRRVQKTIGEFSFHVPAPEERIVISTLQRMYRHFYFRLCDIVDFAELLQDGNIDFEELHCAADIGRIWPGVATFLFLICKYASEHGTAVSVPAEILSAVPARNLRLYAEGGFLRVPKGAAAGLYRSELLGAGRAGDLRAALRLSLLPPLALSAFVAFHITGNDKGIW